MLYFKSIIADLATYGCHDKIVMIHNNESMFGGLDEQLKLTLSGILSNKRLWFHIDPNLKASGGICQENWSGFYPNDV
ncbi:MAG: hypothetical protein AB8C84_01485 [Oligoflexales bacterium]